MTTALPAAAPPGRSFLERFGATILQGGIASIPSALYFYHAEVGLSAQEVWFTGYILAYKWDEDLPYPSLVKMEERSGMSRRNLLRIKDSLVGKGLLRLVPRYNADGGQESNAYDFSALFEQLESYIRRDGPRSEQHVRRMTPLSPSPAEEAGEGVTVASPSPAEEIRGGVTVASHPGVTQESPQGVTRASHESEAIHPEAEQVEAPPVVIKHIPLVKPHPTVVVAVATASQIAADQRLLQEEIGLDAETAKYYAQMAYEHGRLKGYVHQLVDYVRHTPGLDNPAAVLIHLIQQNATRRISQMAGREPKPPRQAHPRTPGTRNQRRTTTEKPPTEIAHPPARRVNIAETTPVAEGSNAPTD